MTSPVLLLQEPDGWVAMCRADANMREVHGATILEAQASLRYQWANPLPLRFPEDFPLMDHEFDSMMRHGTLYETDDQFTWYVLDIAARERNLRDALDERMQSGGMKPLDLIDLMDRVRRKAGI